MNVSVGELRHKVTVQKPITVSDAGYESVSYTDVATVWASIAPLKGREFWTAKQIASTVTHRVIIRYRSDVSANYRILFGSRVFDIETVRNIDERGRWLVMECIERTT